MGEINVVPYIDVMLVLLIIFMITAPLAYPGYQGRSAQGRRGTDQRTARSTTLNRLVLSVDARGRFYLNLGRESAAVAIR